MSAWFADANLHIGIPIDVSLTKREALSHLQNEHFVTDPVFEVCISVV